MGMYVLRGPVSREVELSGKRMLNFSGAAYLDLHRRREIIRAAAEAGAAYGFCGDIGYQIAGKPIYDVEAEAMAFFGADSSVYVASAYIGCLAVAECLARRADILLLGKGAHYSLQHAARLAARPTVEIEAADDAYAVVETMPARGMKPLFLLDGVSPTFGKLVDLPNYLSVAERLDGTILLDDAHGAGTAGATGRGTLEHFGVSSSSIIVVASLSKAFCMQGGVILGPQALGEEIKRTSTVYGSVTLPAMPIAAAAAASLQIVRCEGKIVERLHSNTHVIKSGLRQMGIPVEETEIPIISFTTGSSEANQTIYNYLKSNGILVSLSNYVGAPQEKAIRIAIYSSHTNDDITRLLARLREALRIKDDHECHGSADGNDMTTSC